MKDQASKLREMISTKKTHDIDKDKIQGNIIKKRNARIISITSGKGGVGKTNLTINLGIAISKQNYKVVIIDADLGLANIDVILGNMPRYSLLDVIQKNKDIMEVMSDGPNGMKIISGGSGVIDLVDMPIEKIEYLIESFEKINQYADIILIDTGAGLSKSVVSFVLASHEVILVTTPEPTAITDAYAMIKTIGINEKNKNIKLIINKIESVNEGRMAFEKLQNASQKFLNINLEQLGFVSEDINVSKSVKLQNPVILQYPSSIASKNINNIALKLTSNYYVDIDLEMSKTFFSKVISFFR